MPGMIWYLLLALHTWELKYEFKGIQELQKLPANYTQPSTYLTTSGYDNWGPDFIEYSLDSNAEWENVFTNCGGNPEELLTILISAQFLKVSGWPHPKPSVPLSHFPHMLPAKRTVSVLIELPTWIKFRRKFFYVTSGLARENMYVFFPQVSLAK